MFRSLVLGQQVAMIPPSNAGLEEGLGVKLTSVLSVEIRGIITGLAPIRDTATHIMKHRGGITIISL